MTLEKLPIEKHPRELLPIAIRPITAAETRPLRHTILRPHQAPETLVYPGDNDPDSLHVGAFLGDEIVGIASVVRESVPNENDAQSWRLRGMATRPEVRKQGVGTQLVRACIVHIAAYGGTSLWCVGRTSALSFYHSVGFREEGEEFETPHTGPHYIFRRAVSAEQK